MNHCGTCTACCRVFAIPQVAKPAGAWCQHCTVGVGCKIYEQRPTVCRDYECLWLQAKKRGERIADELRPDRSKVVIGQSTNQQIITATQMPGAAGAWQRPRMHEFLKMFVDGGYTVAIGMPAARNQLLWSARGLREVRMTAPDADGMQWSEEHPNGQHLKGKTNECA